MRSDKSIRKALLLAFILAFFGTNFGQEAKEFSEATGSGPLQASFTFDKWSFSFGGKQLELAKDGRGSQKDRTNRSIRFRITLEAGEELERVVYFSEYSGDLLLLCETNLGGDGSGFITRLNGRTLKPKWRAHIPAFNVSNGIIEGSSAYVAAIGFIGKINLETGRYVWKHDELYRKYKESGAFNIFQTPKIKGQLVVFREDETSNQIEANKATGKIVKVLVN